MDAPPPQEDVRPFIHVAELFGQAGVSVPKVLALDAGRGFLLLTDLGSTTYLRQLSTDTAHKLYLDAIDALLANNLAQPQVYVHRDYHSRNLMVMDGGNPGILDFQDAVYGPITYDLVSLLRDAYIQWDEELVLDWAIRYWERARRAGLPVAPDIDSFYRDFEFMGLQRHLKVLGIFARLYHRDGKAAYLDDMPLVMEYTRKTAGRYRELAPLIRILDVLENTDSGVGFTF
jgi:aminoglycoside/choline kinase family phosphotransferase